MPTSSHLHRITAKDTSIVWPHSNRRKRDLWNLPTLWFHTHWPLVSVDELLSLKLPTFNRVSDRGMSWNTDNWYCFPLSNSTVWTLHYTEQNTQAQEVKMLFGHRESDGERTEGFCSLFLYFSLLFYDISQSGPHKGLSPTPRLRWV